MKARVLAAIGAVSVLAAGAADAAVLVSNDFNDGEQGWSRRDAVLGGVGPGYTQGGALATEDAFAYTFFQASNAYLGDKRAAIGGALTFKMAAVNGADDLGYSPLVLSGLAGEIYAKPTFLPGATLGEFTITLTASSFYKNSQYLPGGPPPVAVTDAEFAAIMADLRGMYLFADWKTGGADLTLLDDVQLIGAGPGVTPVPEPGTWALMILGFGAAGAALRRRQAAFGLA